MIELKEAAKRAEELFGVNTALPVFGNWAKWYHEGIPDGPADVRENERKKAKTQGHCLKCTAMSGCYFIDGTKTFPMYPHHPHCHCEKQHISPQTVTANCRIEKFKGYIFAEKYAYKGKKALFEDKYGYTIDDSDYLKKEYDRQAKEKYMSGDYVLGKLDEEGQRITIDVILKTPLKGTATVKSGWMVRPNGLITCNTPLGDR